MKLSLAALLLLALVGLCLLPRLHCEESDDDDDKDDGVTVEVEDEPQEKVPYKPPTLTGTAFLAEPFKNIDDLKNRWVVSQAKKEGAEEAIAQYDGKWNLEEPKDSAMEGDLSLLLKSKAKHHAIATKLKKPFEFSGKPFVVQYEVKFQNGIDCGGAYIKLLSKETKLDLKNFRDKTPYTIMFGPDKCGADHKLHFIFRHKNPVTGDFEEKHAKKPSAAIDKNFSDKKSHLYTLIVNPDNTFEMLIDNKVVNEGSLLSDVSPPVNPPKEIEDPNDKKPADWDEREKIPDPEAKKPDDWDEDEPENIVDEDAEMPYNWLEKEEELIPDPEAEKPSDWDDDMDGEWEAPLINNPKCKDAAGCGKWTKPTIKNPKYKGKWSAPMISNPDYQGIWKPKMIDNPAYFEDLEPYRMTPIGALGLELWSMNEDIVFDNFLITDDRVVAETWASESFEIKRVYERGSTGKGIWQTLRGAADQHPWLWAVYVVILLLPILLLAICLCPRSGPITPETLDAHKKKTDEASPDDQADDKEEQEEDPGAGGDNQQKKSKSDLEAEEAKDSDEGDEEEEEDVDEEIESKESPRRSPRKRRSRKE